MMLTRLDYPHFDAYMFSYYTLEYLVRAHHYQLHSKDQQKIITPLALTHKPTGIPPDHPSDSFNHFHHYPVDACCVRLLLRATMTSRFSSC